jgi:predicted ATPase
MWLLQLPSLVSASDRELLRRELSGATRERMLREMVEALEVLTAQQPLVLILEDLHWSDYSTLDLVSYLARQRQPAKLMVIGTYRTVELIVSGHPLKAVKQELLAKRKCVELPLEYLSEDAVSQYLAVRFPTNRFSRELAALIHERTEGNPLFMVNAVDYLVAEGSIAEDEGCWNLVAGIKKVEVGVPDSIKQMIEKQIDHLDDTQQRTLEAASVAGAEFSALAVAAGLDEEQIGVEATCDALARQLHFIQDRGVQELPNRDVIPRYGFIHALYQNVFYERLSASRRVQLHRRIGEQEEALHGERAVEMAAELAVHFERAADYKRSANYFHQAAENALRRFAYREAVGLSRKGLELLGRLPETSERTVQELRLHVTQGVPLIATEGYAAAAVGSTYTRARELCRRLGEPQETSQVLWGLWTFHLVRAELETARSIAAEFRRLAPHLPYPGVAMEVTLMHLGELSSAMEYFEEAFSRYDPERQHDDSLRYSQNSGVSMHCHAAWTLWFLGRPDQALARVDHALALARSLSEPHGIAHGLFFAALLHQLRREERLAQERADAAIDISGQHGLALYEALSTVTGGWALSGLGKQHQAIEQIRRGLAAHDGIGMALLRPQFLGMYAEVLGNANQPEDGLRVLDDAITLADRNAERYYEAELHRLKGELLLMHSAGRSIPEAENCFYRALKIAQQQQANSLELRAAMSLVRLHRSPRERKNSQDVLARAYDKFTEGFDTPDLQEARSLLVGNA